MTSAIARLNDFGQSPWYDNITRTLVRGGGLAQLIDEAERPVMLIRVLDLVEL